MKSVAGSGGYCPELRGQAWIGSAELGIAHADQGRKEPLHGLGPADRAAGGTRAACSGALEVFERCGQAERVVQD